MARRSSKKLAAIGAFLAALLLPQSAALAHHATAAGYDTTKTVTVKGVITALNWTNPHIHVHLDVKADAATEDWDVELGSPGAAVVAGIQKEDLKLGTPVTIKGYPGKANAAKTQRTVCAMEAALPEGLVVTFVVGV